MSKKECVEEFPKTLSIITCDDEVIESTEAVERERERKERKEKG